MTRSPSTATLRMPEMPDGVEPVEVELAPVLEDDRAQVELVRSRADAVGDPGRDLRAGEPGRLVEVLDVDVVAGRRTSFAVAAALAARRPGPAGSSSTRRSTPASMTWRTTGPKPP